MLVWISVTLAKSSLCLSLSFWVSAVGSPDTKQTGSVKMSYNVRTPERASEGRKGEAGGRGTKQGSCLRALSMLLSSGKAQTSEVALSAYPGIPQALTELPGGPART